MEGIWGWIDRGIVVVKSCAPFEKKIKPIARPDNRSLHMLSGENSVFAVIDCIDSAHSYPDVGNIKRVFGYISFCKLQSDQHTDFDVALPQINVEKVSCSSRLRPEYKVKGTQLRYRFKEILKDFLPKETIAKQKHGSGPSFGVCPQAHSQLKESSTDSQADFKPRNQIRVDLFDTLLRQHLPVYTLDIMAL
ncbi:MAG: hypothetical protein H6936_07990 [Burkholderiales bacterium]|nr:hypothetical protein [Nitrosomonas sp.]MCP5274781.1 hypothetical protein [Burkholderiales bacterium]